MSLHFVKSRYPSALLRSCGLLFNYWVQLAVCDFIDFKCRNKTHDYQRLCLKIQIDWMTEFTVKE